MRHAIFDDQKRRGGSKVVSNYMDAVSLKRNQPVIPPSGEFNTKEGNMTKLSGES